MELVCQPPFAVLQAIRLMNGLGRIDSHLLCGAKLDGENAGSPVMLSASTTFQFDTARVHQTIPP
jgi:hypothetical protein